MMWFRWILVVCAGLLSAGDECAKRAADCYTNQQKEESYRLFLEALEPPPQGQLPLTPTTGYSEALALYLDPSRSTTENASLILEKFGASTDCAVGYFLAAAHANRGDFPAFYRHFWSAYSAYPDHFMADKAKGVLHIKLLEKAATPESRTKERIAILGHFKAALAKEPRDYSLYRLVLTFADDAERAALAATYVNRIIDNNIITSRGDIKFYIQLLIQYDRRDLASRFLQQAKQWYEYSRAIETAEQYLQGKL